MPKGPNGEKRPADVVANAVHVMRLATGEVEDKAPAGRQHNGMAAKARSLSLSPDQRSDIARKAATARWG